jgi:1-phosphofructokinase family hexose kinase
MVSLFAMDSVGPANDRLLCLAISPAIDRLLEVRRLAVGEISRPVGMVAVPGGKALNTARVAAALNARVTACALLSGHAGRWIADGLAAEHIELQAVWTDGETRTCTSILDHSSGALTEVYEESASVSPADWSAYLELVRSEVAQGPGVVVISGSLPPGPDEDALAELCAIASAAGVFAVVDSSGGALARAVRARPALVKVNTYEATSLLGRPVGQDDAQAAAEELVRLGARSAVVTAGRAGAGAVLDGSRWRVGGPSSEGRYAVGSGDAFLAGLAVAILRRASPEGALRLAAGAAAANAQVAGAGRLDAAAVRRYAADVQVKEIPG